MTLRLASVLLATTFATVALAQPSSTAFSTTTSFRSCTKSWAFACNMRDASGHTYGTARQVEHCETLTFRPDGTYVDAALGPVARGVYDLRNGTVTLTPIDDAGKRGTPFALTLSADGNSLGAFHRL